MCGHKIVPKQLWHLLCWDPQKVEDFSILVGYGVSSIFGQPHGISLQAFSIGFPYFNLKSFPSIRFHLFSECLVINY